MGNTILKKFYRIRNQHDSWLTLVSLLEITNIE
jgi:hypothetical protein